MPLILGFLPGFLCKTALERQSIDCPNSDHRDEKSAHGKRPLPSGSVLPIFCLGINRNDQNREPLFRQSTKLGWMNGHRHGGPHPSRRLAPELALKRLAQSKTGRNESAAQRQGAINEAIPHYTERDWRVRILKKLA